MSSSAMAGRSSDKHLALNVHCVDEEILDWLERREARKKCSAEAAFNKIRKDMLWLQKKSRQMPGPKTAE
jgi:cytidylate kinase